MYLKKKKDSLVFDGEKNCTQVTLVKNYFPPTWLILARYEMFSDNVPKIQAYSSLTKEGKEKERERGKPREGIAV